MRSSKVIIGTLLKTNYMESRRVDFSEPIPKLIERLIGEHKDLYPKLSRIETMSVSDSIVSLEELRPKILHHAVEEEARIMRVIIEGISKESATSSIQIMQEHRWVVNFLDQRLRELPKIESNLAKLEIMKFISDLKLHFEEEEQGVFPLALKIHSKGKP